MGDLVEGVVVSVLDFGAFVELQEGLHGLVHVSEIGYAASEDPKAVLKKGDPVLVKIMGIESGRERILLSMRRVPVSEQMEWMMNLEEVAETAVLDSDQDPGSLESSESADLPAATEVDQLSGEDEPDAVRTAEGEEITSEQEQVLDPEPEIEPEQEDLETSEGD